MDLCGPEEEAWLWSVYTMCWLSCIIHPIPPKKDRIIALESSFNSRSICFPVCIPDNTEGIVGLCEDICVCCVFMRNLCVQGQRRS